MAFTFDTRPILDAQYNQPDMNTIINNAFMQESQNDQQRALEGANAVGDAVQAQHIEQKQANEQALLQGIKVGAENAFKGNLSTIGEVKGEGGEELSQEQIASQKQAIAQSVPLAMDMYYKSLLGDYDMSSTDYYQKQYDAIRKAGYSWRIAKEVAGERAQRYQQNRVDQLSRQFVNAGTNGVAMNGLGAQLLNEIAGENPNAVGILAKMYATPMQQWGAAVDLQKQDAIAQRQQALQNQRLQGAMELARYKNALSNAGKQQAIQAKAAIYESMGLDENSALVYAMAGINPMTGQNDSASSRSSRSRSGGDKEVSGGKKTGSLTGLTRTEITKELKALEEAHANDGNRDWESNSEDGMYKTNLLRDQKELRSVNIEDLDLSKESDRYMAGQLLFEELLAKGVSGEEFKQRWLRAAGALGIDDLANDFIGTNGQMDY